MPDCMASIRFAMGADGRIKPMYKVSEGVRSTHCQDGAVVLDIRQGKMFNLNLVGSRILELLKAGYSESEIADSISHEFDTGREVVERDLAEFLAALKSHKLMDEQQAGEPAGPERGI